MLGPISAADNMARFYNAHQRESPLYMVGDKVLLNGQNITMTRLMKKLDHKWLGPIPCGQFISQSAYQTETTLIIWPNSPHVSVTLLRPYNTDVITEQVQCDPPPPVVHDGVEEYEVELILEQPNPPRKTQLSLHWKGYGNRGAEWRPSEDIKGVRRTNSTTKP